MASSSKLVGTALIVGLLIGVVVLNLGIAYIIFAPGSLPKPFHLSYNQSGVDIGGTVGTSSGEAPASHSGSPEGYPDESSADPSLLKPDVAHAADSQPEPQPLITTREVRQGHGLMIDTNTKIINLAAPNGRKYIRVNVVLEFLPPDLAFYEMEGEEKHAFVVSFEEEVNRKMPLIDDSIITLVSSKQFDDIYTADGKEALRIEIRNIVNSRLLDYLVINVYLTEFVVQ